MGEIKGCGPEVSVGDKAGENWGLQGKIARHFVKDQRCDKLRPEEIKAEVWANPNNYLSLRTPGVLTTSRSEEGGNFQEGRRICLRPWSIPRQEGKMDDLSRSVIGARGRGVR